MKLSKKQIMYSKIQAHGETLLSLFPHAKQKDPIKLCKQFRKLEYRAHWITEDYCNGVARKMELRDHGPHIHSEEFTDYWTNEIHLALLKITGTHNIPIKINWDPRGYSLKIDDQYVRDNNLSIYRDWGGYGILAPDFSED